MNYIVTLDQKLTVVGNNRAEVPDGHHGVIVGEEPYNYRSRHPFIIAWMIDDIEKLNDAKFALVRVTSTPLQTQLVNPRLGQVFNVERVYEGYTEEELSLLHAKPISLADLLAQAPQLYVEPKRFPSTVRLRLTEDQASFLKQIGGGNLTEGARQIIDQAIESKPALSSIEIPKNKTSSVTFRLTDNQAQFLSDAGEGHNSRGAQRLFQWALENSPTDNDQSLGKLPSENND